MNQTTSIRPPAVAGLFYPGDVDSLRQELGRCLNAVPPAPIFLASSVKGSSQGILKAVIVPHAGYIYSGETAGCAYSAIAARAKIITRVVVLGPTHRVSIRGVAVSSADYFATPLGQIPLDRVAIDALTDLPQIVVSDAAHEQEHSLEVQLPFLQAVLGKFSLVPLAVGQSSTLEVANVIDLLWGGDETLIVASSDLSHYHAYIDAQRMDGHTAEHILKLELLTSFEQACGALPINGLLHVAKQRGLSITRLAQCNSGDTAGDKVRVVGYASFGLYETERQAHDLGPALLAAARRTIAAEFGVATPAKTDPAAMSEPGATFVTLTLDCELRGCIGSLEAHRSLGDDVRANALAAAFRDPRFAPLSAAEFARIKIEVSLLSKPVPLQFGDESDALRQLRPGIDGVILVAGHARSTFLPQVWEQLPDPRLFMAHLKQKAGLPTDWWSPNAQIFRYEVQKWKE